MIKYGTQPRALIVEHISMVVKVGQGTPEDPIRYAYQLWTKDGVLVAEFDPHSENGWYRPEDFIRAE